MEHTRDQSSNGEGEETTMTHETIVVTCEQCKQQYLPEISLGQTQEHDCDAGIGTKLSDQELMQVDFSK